MRSRSGPSAWFTWGASLVLLGGYGVLYQRVRRQRRRQGDSRRDAALYARYCVLGKFMQLAGVVQYRLNRLLGRQTKIIEYKGSGGSAGGPSLTPGGGSSGCSVGRLHGTNPLFLGLSLLALAAIRRRVIPSK